MRQLRVAPDSACKLAPGVYQRQALADGTTRRRQFVKHCYGPYASKDRRTEPFGPEELRVPFSGGFAYSSEVENRLTGMKIPGLVGTPYDGSGYVRDLDSLNRPSL